MKPKLLSSIFVLSVIISTSDVYSQPNPAKVIDLMQKFSWMTGDWKGEAWYLDRDQKKVQIVQNEHIIARLNGAIITMEGTGYDIPAGTQEAKVVFQAFGILTYDLSNSKYVLRAYQGANFIDSDFTPNPDGSFSWGIDVSYGKTRYKVRLTPEGKWNEVGEFSRDGTEWVKNFEMTLTKI
jgi:hypothetical protein